jgi:hypothetical protein
MAGRMNEHDLLAQPRLTIVSGEPDFELGRIAETIRHSVMVSGCGELAALFGQLLAAAEHGAAVAPKTLDLIGHTRSSASLLTLGDWVIDSADPTTAAFMRWLAEHRVLPRLGVQALRLLGCNSAGSAHGRATICALGDLLGLEIYGSKQLLYAVHYGSEGFRDCWRFLLVAASELRRQACAGGVAPPGVPSPRTLDLDALPAVTLGPTAGPYPRCIANAQAARQILALVRRGGGAPMPGVAAAPVYELALPSTTPGAYHVAHVLFEGAFLRFYPDGMAAAGIVFPVDDVDALRRIITALRPDPELSQ